ncbi:MAG: DUF6513 domain-containing protein, partial [Gammaproteobacteria bacterium]
MAERVLFLTGRLAAPALERTLAQISPREFEYAVRDLGLSVAALMTADMIERRLDGVGGADRVLVPGLCGGELTQLARRFQVPFEKGPKDLKDLPEFFGTKARAVSLNDYSVRIFAEIVDAPERTVEQIVQRAERYRRDGADVIDIGCLPGQVFDHMEDGIAALKGEGFEVSIDSVDGNDLLRGARAGADYLLSLKESTLDLRTESGAIPVLIPEQPGDMDSLYRAAEVMAAEGRAFFVDAILDPIHFGFSDSIARYKALRERVPEAAIFMGTGNVTELTDADTTGMAALLLGIASELDAAAILTTEVSRHALTAVKEADLARRIMHAARADHSLPRGYHAGLMAHRDRKPFPYTPDEIAHTAAAIKDPSFRIQVSEAGLHI